MMRRESSDSGRDATHSRKRPHNDVANAANAAGASDAAASGGVVPVGGRGGGGDGGAGQSKSNRVDEHGASVDVDGSASRRGTKCSRVVATSDDAGPAEAADGGGVVSLESLSGASLESLSGAIEGRLKDNAARLLAFEEEEEEEDTSEGGDGQPSTKDKQCLIAKIDAVASGRLDAGTARLLNYDSSDQESLPDKEGRGREAQEREDEQSGANPSFAGLEADVGGGTKGDAARGEESDVDGTSSVPGAAVSAQQRVPGEEADAGTREYDIVKGSDGKLQMVPVDEEGNAEMNAGARRSLQEISAMLGPAVAPSECAYREIESAVLPTQRYRGPQLSEGTFPSLFSRKERVRRISAEYAVLGACAWTLPEELVDSIVRQSAYLEFGHDPASNEALLSDARAAATTTTASSAAPIWAPSIAGDTDTDSQIALRREAELRINGGEIEERQHEDDNCEQIDFGTGGDSFDVDDASSQEKQPTKSPPRAYNLRMRSSTSANSGTEDEEGARGPPVRSTRSSKKREKEESALDSGGAGNARRGTRKRSAPSYKEVETDDDESETEDDEEAFSNGDEAPAKRKAPKKRNTVDPTVQRNVAYEELQEQYSKALVLTQQSHQQLSLAEQHAEAAKLVRWTDELRKAIWKRWKKKTGQNVPFSEWENALPVAAKQNWLAVVRRQLGWGIIAPNLTTRALGERTAKAEINTAIGAAQLNLENGLGLVMLYATSVEDIWEGKVHLESVRDRASSGRIPQLPKSISRFFANNDNEAIRMAIVGFESSQRLLKLVRGDNLCVSGEKLLKMTDAVMETHVDKLLAKNYRQRSGRKGRDLKRKRDLERAARLLVLKWCRHQLKWMVTCFKDRKCGLFTKRVKRSLLPKGEKNEFPAEHFPGPKKGKPVPRWICPGAQIKYGTCTSVSPMYFPSHLLMCLSIPSLVNTDSVKDGASLIKDDETVRDAHLGVTVNNEQIARQLHATKLTPAKTGSLTTFNWGIPRAEGSISAPAAKPDCSCSICKDDRKKRQYTQSQHRFVRCMAHYYGVMNPLDGFDPSSLELEFAEAKDLEKLAREGDNAGAIDSFVEKVINQLTCDTDHLVGRSEEIYNSLYTTFPCSHSMNAVLAWIRIIVGDWCYGLSELEYTGGNA